MTATFDFSRRSDLVDDGGRPIDAILVGTDDVAAAVSQAVQQGYAVMPAGGLTSAINSFDYPVESLAGLTDVVVIRPKGAMTPEVVPASTPLEQIRSNQMAIDAERGCVAVGAGLTYGQVNMVLAHMLGDTARVLVDLTSSASASVGGVVATGGMGPLRTHPSSYLQAVCLADGNDQPRLLTGDDIVAHEGMQGWTGMVTAVRMRWFEVPPQEFGLVLPIQGSDVDAVADLLSALHPWTQVAVPPDGNVLMAADGGSTIVNGIELISRPSLAQFVAHAADPARSKAEGLLQACDYANADMLACITGWSEMPVDEVLFSLMDEATETIGGIGIDYGIGFSSGSEMEIFRAIREGAPDLARTQARVVPPGKLRPWTTSTDVNVRVPKDTAAIGAVLQAYADYRAAIAELAERLTGRAELILSAYGHLSPQGIDPHHRVTVIADEGQEAALDEARQAIGALKKQLIRDLAAAVNEFGGTLTGGEKGMPSVLDIARAVGDNALPPNLKARIERARGTLAAAHKAFSFRAPRL